MLIVGWEQLKSKATIALVAQGEEFLTSATCLYSASKDIHFSSNLPCHL